MKKKTVQLPEDWEGEDLGAMEAPKVYKPKEPKPTCGDDDWGEWDWEPKPKAPAPTKPLPSTLFGQPAGQSYAQAKADLASFVAEIMGTPTPPAYSSDSQFPEIMPSTHLPIAIWRAETALEILAAIEMQKPEAWNMARQFFVDVRHKVECVLSYMGEKGRVTAKQFKALKGWLSGVQSWYPDYDTDKPMPPDPEKSQILPPVPTTPLKSMVNLLELRAKRHRRNVSIPDEE